MELLDQRECALVVLMAVIALLYFLGVLPIYAPTNNACDCLFLFIPLPTAFWRRQWHPTPVLLPGKSHGRRSLVGYSPWGHKELDTTEHTHTHTQIHWLNGYTSLFYFLMITLQFTRCSLLSNTSIVVKCDNSNLPSLLLILHATLTNI